MSGISEYSTNPASNTLINSINVGEGCPPSNMNDAVRQAMADIRAQCEDAEWFDWGHTATYASGTSFTITGMDVTDEYHAGRRIRAVGSSTGTIYGTISSSSFSTDTTVNVTWDSGNLENETLAVSLGILRAENPSLPNSDAARSALGLGSMATQDADSVAITGGSANFTGSLSMESTAAGGGEAPVAELYRNRSSPSNNEDLGAIHFTGNDSGGNKHTFAAIETAAVTVTDGAEDGQIRLQTSRGGSVLAARLFVGAGVWTQGATGTDPGGGKINAQGYQINGADVFPVGQSQLKTTTGTVSLTDDEGRTSNPTLPGGQYGFYPEATFPGGLSAASTAYWAARRGYVGTVPVSFVTSVELNVTPVPTGNNMTVTVRQRYIQSSPPYDHGDGPVQGYVYAELRPDGRVGGLYVAEDPPWYGNTAHAPREQFVKDGKPFGRFVRPACRLCDLKAGKITLDEYMARAGECEVVEEEITPAVKLRGMADLPQPFLDAKPGRTVVLLDPMDELTGRLIRMMQAGESVPELFAEGYLRVDNEALKRCGPPGVPVHPAKWR